MLPHGYELPSALVLVLSGALACFAGQRLFRVVLALYGFILGALMASSIMAASNVTGMVVAAVVGGVTGALVLVLGYYVAVALVGAGLGALIAHLVWSRIGAADPPAIAIIVVSIFGAVAAMVLQRYVIIVGTAFGGAWTLLVGAVAAGVGGVVVSNAASEAWILYPLAPAPDVAWLQPAWIVLGLVGTAVQFGVTARKR
jgi:hypothetical protein